MNVWRRNQDFKAINTVLKFYSIARKNHYDVLNLRRTCTDKEIKEAYIQLSKEYHPDKNKDAKAQEKFVRIVEAYNVLGKPGSRARYDSITEVAGSSAYVYRSYAPYNVRNSTQYSYYYTPKGNAKTAKESTNSYYGFAGIKKLPNFYVIMVCFGVAMIGVMLQIWVIRNLYVNHRKESLEKSKILGAELERIRAQAESNGNEMQTRLLLDKIVTAANPTVATASLGQALASEKK